MLELKSVSKVFRDPAGGEWLLADGLNLTVKGGDTIAILGPSGTGKSTLLKMVAGLEPLDSGRVWFDGVDITQLPPEQRRFALIFQDFALFPHLNVLDNVAFGLVEQRGARAEARQRALDMLQIFGLASHAAQKVWKLSGGEQQRVALARALITLPRLLLLDEPFSALDAELRAGLRAEFNQRIKASGIAALLVTHDEVEARAMAKHGFRLFRGGFTQVW